MPPTKAFSIPESELAEKIGRPRDVLRELRLKVLEKDEDWISQKGAVRLTWAGAEKLVRELGLASLAGAKPEAPAPAGDATAPKLACLEPRAPAACRLEWLRVVRKPPGPLTLVVTPRTAPEGDLYYSRVRSNYKFWVPMWIEGWRDPDNDRFFTYAGPYPPRSQTPPAEAP